jgi:UDP-N-acetylmuramoyl-L-alanyl-D-glutamate--2,6-diaminopimelate ligase
MVRWFIDRTPQKGAPSVSLRRLLPEAKIVGGQDWEVSGCASDTQKLQPGQVFVAVGNARADGQTNTLVQTALSRGARGVIVERAIPEAGQLQAVVPDARAAYGRLCHALAGDPSQNLDVIGVAGGSDARLVTLLLHSIMTEAGQRFGEVSPQGWSDGHAWVPPVAGFSESEGLAGMLGGMVKRRCSGALVEFSQSALDHTTMADGLELSVAVVPSVRESSEDDEASLQARRRAFARLVRRVSPGGVVVVNEDDPDCEILGAVNLLADRVSIGIDKPADVRAEVEWYEAHRSRFRLLAEGMDTMVTLRLGGIESIQAALAAAAVARQRGVDEATIMRGLEMVEGIPGRFERIDEGQEFEVRVDAAKSPEELIVALAQARQGLEGRIFCVVGAEGHADLGERVRLGQVVHELADMIIFTSDNPRAEEPASILDDLHAATDWADHIRLDPDRRRAIETALSMAMAGDVVLIAGKGRNAFQILEDRVIPFDDRGVAARWLRAERTNQATRESA